MTHSYVCNKIRSHLPLISFLQISLYPSNMSPSNLVPSAFVFILNNSLSVVSAASYVYECEALHWSMGNPTSGHTLKSDSPPSHCRPPPIALRL